jgi:prolyl-tRNA editing enzyme YbaK/EbsC (Cys-tRNA(Pro) deacylase)
LRLLSTSLEKSWQKTVMVKIDDKMAMAVLPASLKVSFDLLKKAAGASKVELANEREFRNMFPESEVGAMPPFGNLMGWKFSWTKACPRTKRLHLTLVLIPS